MNQTLGQRVGMGVLLAFLIIVGIAMYSARVLAQAPLEVTLTGTFLSLKDKGDLHAYILSVRDKNYLFQITNIEVPQPVPEGASGWSVLDEISPPKIQLIGNEKDIQLLKQPDALGKSFVLRGTLYVADAVLVLTSAKEVSK
jgi:hypothetical protein